MYEFNLPNAVPVKRVFDYASRRFDGVFTQYGGSALMEHINGDTFLAVFGGNLSQPNTPNTLVRLYHVNPHAGQFVNVGNETTRHVTITPIKGKSLTDAEVREVQRELAGLK